MQLLHAEPPRVNEAGRNLRLAFLVIHGIASATVIAEMGAGR
jgi:hypothetical protein